MPPTNPNNPSGEIHQNPITLPALILSVMVHLGVFVALSWQSTTPPTPKPITTELISQGQFDAIKAQIQANAAAKTTTQQTQKPSDYDKLLAQRQAEFDAQMAQFNAEQTAKSLNALKELEQELQTLQALENQALEQARQAFEQYDDIVKQNQDKLNENQRRDEPNPNNNSTTDHRTQANPSTQAPTTVGARGDSHSPPSDGTGDKQSVQAAIVDHIKRYWQPSGKKGTRLSTKIVVDSTGNVLSVHISGGSSAEQQVLEDAIYAASPITPIAGTAFRTLSPYFVIQ